MASKPSGINFNEESYRWGMTWYVKTDPEQWPWKLTNILLSPGQPELMLRRHNEDGSQLEITLYVFEASTERDENLYAETRKRKQDEG